MALRKKKPDQSVAGNAVKLVCGGTAYFTALKELIGKAKDIIHLQVYILAADTTGTAIMEALKAAAARNVRVYLVADGYASQHLPAAVIDDMKAAGIQFRFFEPLFRSRQFYFGRRMHHKILVVDTRYAVTGGRNITDRYNDLPGEPAWLDFAVVTEGPIAAALCEVCWKTWKGFPGKKIKFDCRYDAKEEPAGSPLCDVRVRQNDWVRRKNEISKTYAALLRGATQEVTIMSSYFLPGSIIRKQMARAARRGVKIRVVTTGVSDVAISKSAERWLYDWLLRTGVEIYEYQKNVLHAKIGLCDRTWVTVGSYNINNISAQASVELNLDINNESFAATTADALATIIENDCLQITESMVKKRKNPINQFGRWLSYQFIRVMIYLFTFYFKQVH